MNGQLRLSLEPRDFILADTTSVHLQTFSSYNA